MAAIPGLLGETRTDEHPADLQLSQRCRDLTIGLKVVLHVLARRKATLACPLLAEYLPVDLGVPARRGVAVLHVELVD